MLAFYVLMCMKHAPETTHDHEPRARALAYSSTGILVNPRSPTGLARIRCTRYLRALHVQTHVIMHARPTRARSRCHLLAHLQ